MQLLCFFCVCVCVKWLISSSFFCLHFVYCVCVCAFMNCRSKRWRLLVFFWFQSENISFWDRPSLSTYCWGRQLRPAVIQTLLDNYDYLYEVRFVFFLFNWRYIFGLIRRLGCVFWRSAKVRIVFCTWSSVISGPMSHVFSWPVFIALPASYLSK